MTKKKLKKELKRLQEMEISFRQWRDAIRFCHPKDGTISVKAVLKESKWCLQGK